MSELLRGVEWVCCPSGHWSLYDFDGDELLQCAHDGCPWRMVLAEPRDDGRPAWDDERA